MRNGGEGSSKGFLHNLVDYPKGNKLFLIKNIIIYDQYVLLITIFSYLILQMFK